MATIIERRAGVVNFGFSYVTGDPSETSVDIVMNPSFNNFSTLNLEELRAVAYEMLRVVEDIEDSNA